MDTLYVGIDVAKASFVAAAQGPAGESLWGEFANTPAGFAQRTEVPANVLPKRDKGGVR
jgi:transposase